MDDLGVEELVGLQYLNWHLSTGQGTSLKKEEEENKHRHLVHMWQFRIEFRYYSVFNVLRYSVLKV